jgi:hypothetical protein
MMRYDVDDVDFYLGFILFVFLYNLNERLKRLYKKTKAIPKHVFNCRRHTPLVSPNNEKLIMEMKSTSFASSRTNVKLFVCQTVRKWAEKMST